MWEDRLVGGLARLAGAYDLILGLLGAVPRGRGVTNGFSGSFALSPYQPSTFRLLRECCLDPFARFAQTLWGFFSFMIKDWKTNIAIPTQLAPIGKT
ncbi:jg18038 [Pararge aegeria aegeria]|uniref:Jg18038 protein n=1 Tax=Pararge aegeria aegeria TaxID=348720 RepID=A0A8S4QIA1_9NEOP|nr:jg18038 [Pararge aegeria aegeria]